MPTTTIMLTHTIHRAPLCSVAPFGVLRWLVVLLAIAIGPVSAQGLASRAAVLTSEGVPSLAGAPASARLDLRYRVGERYHVFADAARVRGFEAASAVAPVEVRVGVDWQPSKSTLELVHGAFGVQLDSGARVTLKVRRGGPMLYLRSRF